MTVDNAVKVRGVVSNQNKIARRSEVSIAIDSLLIGIIFRTFFVLESQDLFDDGLLQFREKRSEAKRLDRENRQRREGQKESQQIRGHRSM